MRSPLSQALTDRMNLAVLGIAVAAGLLAAWWLFPIGLVVWGIMLIVTINQAASQL
jgi:hypothetical protein